MVSYHEHNEAARTPELVAKLEGGANIALVSDAGTPLVSDPGYRLVTAAIGAGIPVVPIPGASAVLGALSGAGLPTDAFRFCGFLPPKQGQRRKLWKRFAAKICTLVFYEAPHRIMDALSDIVGGVWRTSGGGRARADQAARRIPARHRGRSSRPARRAAVGERRDTLLIGKGAPVAADTPVEDAVRELEQKGVPRMDAIKQVARERGLSKRDVYQTVTQV